MDLIITKRKEKRARNNLIGFFVLLTLICCFGCRDSTKAVDKIVFLKDAEINESNFKQIDHGFVIKFSNVLEDSVKPNILVPIYRGTLGNVRLSQLMQKLKRKDYILGSIIIDTGQRKVKEGILDCVNFYKKSLLKNTDIKEPSMIGLEMYGMFIWYDFDYEGIPGTIMISVAYDPNCEKGKFICKYKYIEDIEVNENAREFYISINLGEKSYWREEKEKSGK